MKTAASVKGIYVTPFSKRKTKQHRLGSLSSILDDEAARPAAEVPEEEAGIIIASLKGLADHPLIREIEDSQACYSERTFERAFNGFTLRGVVDKLYKTSEGWKIADFKYAENVHDSLEGYRFQMEFYLYLLEKILAPVCAKILFLKDGQTERSYSKIAGVRSETQALCNQGMQHSFSETVLK